MKSRSLLVALAIVIAGAFFAALPAHQASANGNTVHCVKYGETLYGIGYMYGVSAHAIAQANGLWNPNYIRAGQCLTIPSHGYGHGGWDGQGEGHGAGNNHGDGDNCKGCGGQGHGGYQHNAGYSYGGHHNGMYCVKYGDTLSGIAAMHGVSTYALCQANGLWNPNFIRAGTCLTIPSW